MGKLRTIRNSLRQRRVQVQRGVCIGDCILITRNESRLGKKYVARLYENGKLMASYPVDKLEELNRDYLSFNN